MLVISGYDAWLTPERLEKTEGDWAKLDRTGIIAAIEKYVPGDVKHVPGDVIEFCCGTGWIPKGLSKGIQYLGIDANEGCLALAREKNPCLSFSTSVGDMKIDVSVRRPDCKTFA